MEKKHGDAEIAEGTKASGRGFEWEYLAGSNLKSQLTYPNDAVVTWSYEPHRDLLTAVTNATYSTYVYTNDLLGRRTSKNDEQYGYNVRDELTSADEVSYNYDDIGNRTTAEGKTYTANNLNQYTAIDDFAPQYDADGNQTLIKTETGVWSVVYNAENRPVHWQSDDTVITMSFDRMGRRVDYQETRAGQVATHFRFAYDNFLCVQRLNAANGNAVRTEFVWDPTEPIATRLLVMRAKNWDLNLFYTHDGNKNVSEVFYHALQNGIAAHYDYAPFGAVTRTSRATRVSNRDFIAENPFRFSSEYHDATLGLVYYNYRHYNSREGRWNRRDPIDELEEWNLFGFVTNNPIIRFDVKGCFGSPSPSIIDHFGNSTSPLGEEKWFEENYTGWLKEARKRFTEEINAGVDCSSVSFNGPSSRINIYPSVNRGGATTKRTRGGNEQDYGDAGQTDWSADKVLGSFSIDYVTPVKIVYATIGNGKRSYTWTTTMYVEDVLGSQDGDFIRKIPGIASITPSRRVRRASWTLSGSGECCEK